MAVALSEHCLPTPRRVCLIKPSSLGDVVHAFPTLLALRELWPMASFSWVINSGLRSLVEGHPAIDDVLLFDRRRISMRPSGLSVAARFVQELRKRRFDLVIDLQGLLRSGLMARASGAPYRVGYSEAREGAGAFYTHRVTPSPPETHAVDRLLQLATDLGATPSPPRFQVAMSDQDRTWAKSILARCASPRLVLNMGARWLTKRWPSEHFASIARRAADERGASLVAVGAPEDRPLVEDLKSRLGDRPVLDLCGATTLPQLAAISAACDVFLSNDTGPLHLAAAAGARVVGIYTCTSPARTGPYGSRARVVQSRVWCAPSYVKTCARLECLCELSPERVWPVVAQALDEATSERSSFVTGAA